MKVGDYVSGLQQQFSDAGLCFAHGTDNSYDEACYLVFASLSLDWQEFEAELDRQLTPAEIALLDRRSRQRIRDRIPTAYLVGTAWFAGHEFKADSRALIPRSPIAELIENRFTPLLRQSPQRVLDLCCGGGCIGIAIALEFPDASVDLADLSVDALGLAKENIDRFSLQDRVAPLQSDLFSGLPGQRYDLIVSNPPYVGAEELSDLPAEFRHEPRSGLESDDQGLQLPLRILSAAADHLAESGVLVMEVGYSHHLLAERYPDIPFLWLDFQRGGEGVFLLRRQQLEMYRERFS